MTDQGDPVKAILHGWYHSIMSIWRIGLQELLLRTQDRGIHSRCLNPVLDGDTLCVFFLYLQEVKIGNSVPSEPDLVPVRPSTVMQMVHFQVRRIIVSGQVRMRPAASYFQNPVLLFHHV